jgi:bacterioferritin-associated ferredoxin
MYVCICAAVTDREVRKAAAAGADTLDKLTMALGVGAGCGCCREAAQQVLVEAGCGQGCACPQMRQTAAA